MRDLYHHAMYDGSRPVPSYWEATAGADDCPQVRFSGEESCDVAVIGGGYTGVSAALHLARDHAVDVRVLEAGHLGWGASGRNGGFCCLPAMKMSVAALVRRYGLEEARRFFAQQVEGMRLVLDLETEEGLAFDRCGDGNFEVAHAPSRFAGLADYAARLSRDFGIPARVLSKGEFAECGHTGTEQHGAIHIDAGFALHPLKLLRAMARAAARHGARLHAHSEVLEWAAAGGWHVLHTAGGRLRAKRVVVATNGFTRDRLHRALAGRLMPVVSNILVTRQMSEMELARHRFVTQSPICNTRELLFYYRLLPDRRLLFGARGDTSGREQAGERIRAWMARRLREVFPAWRDIEAEYFWRGLVCMSAKRSPSMGQLPGQPSVWYALGYHANGVNTAPWAGMALARCLAGTARLQTLVPAPLRGLPPRLVLGKQRLWLLRAAYLWYRLRDMR